MKEIKAYIRPMVLDSVILHSENAGARVSTVIRVDARGAGVEKFAVEHRLFNMYAAKYSAAAKLEIVCGDNDAGRFAGVIRKGAHPGATGDGRIFIRDIGFALNIRNTRTGEEAL